MYIHNITHTHSSYIIAIGATYILYTMEASRQVVYADLHEKTFAEPLILSLQSYLNSAIFI